MADNVKVKFWGVRGSVPTPLTSEDLKKKYVALLKDCRLQSHLTVERYLELEEQKSPLTYGGNTSCVEVRYGDQILVMDMGTGLRPFGNSLFPEMFKQNGINVHFFLSHVHWDHIQGLPFFGPLYINKETGIDNLFNFYGGTDWQKNAETCLRGQMDPPNFPVSFQELMNTTHMNFDDLYDMKKLYISGGELGGVLRAIKVTFRKLNHPQETYGIRLEFPNKKVVTYTTDNEPYNPKEPDPRLVNLAKDADIWITDCQYTHEIYSGKTGGVSRRGWGHSYPEAVAMTALEAGVKKVLLFHHDPGSSDEAIYSIQNKTNQLLYEYADCEFGGKRTPGVEVQAAYEGLEINL